MSATRHDSLILHFHVPDLHPDERQDFCPVGRDSFGLSTISVSDSSRTSVADQAPMDSFKL
jgi:hypothetical protein